MAGRRLSASQVARLVEGAELISAATGLAISEIVSWALSEPAEQEEEDSDEIEIRPLASGDR